MSKPLLCPKCGHRNSQHIYVVIHHSKALSEDAISCEACECLNYNTTEENLRAVKRSKPPRTNIDKQIDEILHNKIDHQLDDWSEAVPALKQLLLTYIKELVGEEEPKSGWQTSSNPDVAFAPGYRNQLRQEILRKAEEDLGMIS